MPSDITEEEEAMLPLPDHWARQYSSSLHQVIYRNLNTGVESLEHPYILQAMSSARKQPLPPNWLVKEVKLANGDIDYFYSNSVLNISMWDPPTLRQCLIVCLQNQGLNGAAKKILDGGNMNINDKSDFKSPVEVAYQNYLDSVQQSNIQQNNLEEVYKFYQSNDNSNNNLVDDINDDNNMIDEVKEEVESVEQNVSYIKNQTNLHLRIEERVDKQEKEKYMEKWKLLKEAYEPKTIDLIPKTHRLEKSRPPKTYVGLKVLDCDIKFAVKRVHELLVQLRLAIGEKSGLNCKVINFSALSSTPSPTQLKDNESIYIESCKNLVFELRRRPDIIINTMSGIKDSSPIRMHIGFIVLHRLLHPFSSDYSLTTSLLLEAIKVELTDLSPIESMFDKNGRDIRNRALFITDPATAYQWNVLAQPLPLMPNVPSETVTASLLKLYAIRRDVTSFFRALWKPVFPSAVAVLTKEQICMSTFADLVAVANRILECVLSDSAALIFPATASAICRTFHNIGGDSLMHIYVLDFLILPNMIKIFGNIDPESLENEISYGETEIMETCNKCFDLNTWWPIEGYDTVPFNPLHSLLWIVWRLYTGATHIDDSSMVVLKTNEFFRGGPITHIDMGSGIADAKLRILLARLQHKLKFYTQHLLSIPLDVEACKYLNIDHKVTLEDFKGKQQFSHMILPPKLVHQRSLLVNLKAYDMSTFSIISRNEATTLLSEVNIMLESSEHKPENSIFDKDLSDFFKNNKNIDKNGEDIMILMISLSGDFDNFESLSNDTVIPWEKLRTDEQQFFQETKDIVDTFYHQLCRSLTLANKYEDTLLHMIQNIDNFYHRTIHDLVESDDHHSTIETNILEKDIPSIARKHTNVSAQKMKDNHYGLHSFALKEAKMRKYKPNIDTSRETLFHNHLKTFRFEAEDTSHPDLTITKRAYYNRKPTKIEVNLSARFLVPTESEKNKALAPPSTYKDNEKEYLSSLRTHEPLSQGDYSFRRSRNRRFVSETSSIGSSSAQSYGTSIKTPKPFPEHLRHRVRDNNEGIDSRYLPSFDYEEYQEEKLESKEDNRNDYKYIFTPIGRRPAYEDLDVEYQNYENEDEDIEYDEVPNNKRYLLPTESLLQKLSNTEPSSKFFHALHDGRLYLREPSNLQDEAELIGRRQNFKPSLINIVPSNGPRAVRIKPTDNRSPTRSLSPIKSRSSSPKSRSKSPIKNRKKNFFVDDMDRTYLKLMERREQSAIASNQTTSNNIDVSNSENVHVNSYPTEFYNDNYRSVDTERDDVRLSTHKSRNEEPEVDDDDDDQEIKFIKDSNSNDNVIEQDNNNNPFKPPKPKPIKTTIVEREKEDLKLFSNGIQVTKYHRNGGSKDYKLKYNEVEQKIEWIAVYNSYFTSSKKDKNQDSNIKINEITEIRKGKTTDVFSKATNVDPTKSLSIITSERSLDLVFLTVRDRDSISRALDDIISKK